MTKMIDEADVSIHNLFLHMIDSGVECVQRVADETRIVLHTECGIGYTVSLVSEKTFIRLTTILPLNPKASREQKVTFANELNEDVFLPSFSINPRGDLRVDYVLSYRHGLLAGQFMSLVLRFGSILKFVVNAKNAEGLIDFGAIDDEAPENADMSILIKSPAGFLN